MQSKGAQQAVSAAPALVPGPPRVEINESYLDILLEALRNAQPGQHIDSVMTRSSPPMTVKQLDDLCREMQFVV